MIRSLVELFMHEGSKVERAAVVSRRRAAASTSRRCARVLDELDARGVAHRVLFLDADEQTLLNRYKETRRRHPLAPEGVGRRRASTPERAMLEPMRERADVVIDTTGLKAPHAAPQDRRRAARARTPPTRLAVTFESFGFKHGPPRDADLVFDVRFLPNPHYEPEPARR